jgi:hypothetical protein
VSLSEGEELQVRIYPWYNGTANSKTLCISDVTISGMALDASAVSDDNDGIVTGINSHISPSDEKVTYYNLAGQRTNQKQKGVCLIKRTLSNVSTTIEKTIVQ